MFLAIVSLMFFLAVVQGFVRVVMYFWGWLSQGEKCRMSGTCQADLCT